MGAKLAYATAALPYIAAIAAVASDPTVMASVIAAWNANPGTVGGLTVASIVLSALAVRLAHLSPSPTQIKAGEVKASIESFYK